MTPEKGGCIGKASDLMSAGFGFQLWDEYISANDPVTAALDYVITENDFLHAGVNFSANGGMQSMSVVLIKQ